MTKKSRAKGASRPVDARAAKTPRVDRHPHPTGHLKTIPAVKTSHPAPNARGLTPRALLALYRPDICVLLETLHAPDYRYTQVCEHLFACPHLPFAAATTLPTNLRVRLDALGASTTAVVASNEAPDGTTKLLLQGRDGAQFETVLMHHQHRTTVCLSSQVGCPVGCVFCATGAMGFRRNLASAEIVDQVRAAAALAREQGRRVSNLVYMGMGEPLLNLQAVLDSIRIVTEPAASGIAQRAVSVSSVGIPSGITRLAQTEPQVHLALSLHAADDRTRARLIPARFRHPIAEILEAAWKHFEITHRKLFVEYVLLRNVNDSREHARRLTDLLRDHVVTVNLLNWNPIPQAAMDGSQTTHRLRRRPAPQENHVCETFVPSTRAAVETFRNTLAEGGIEAVIRRSKGAGIGAACGQLVADRHSYRTAPGGKPCRQQETG